MAKLLRLSKVLQCSFMQFALIIITCLFLISESVFAQYPIYTSIVGKSAPKGYYFLNAFKYRKSGNDNKTYLTILDHLGRLVYYKQSVVASDFKIHPNGLISYFENGKYYLMNGKFQVVDSVSCIGNGINTDAHDMKIVENGNYLLLGWEVQNMDLSSYRFRPNRHPGKKVQVVSSGVIQLLSNNKQKVLFEWHAKDYMHFDEMDINYCWDTSTVDWTHFNTINQDKNGNFLLSSKHQFEITKVDGKNGNILWRMGGMGNQFQILKDSLPFFAQHDVQQLPNGNLLFLDNGYCDVNRYHATRAVEYKLDETHKRAELIWSFRHSPDIFSFANGNVQHINDEYTLVNYGKIFQNNLMFQVIDKTSKAVMELSYKDTFASLRVLHYSTLPFVLQRPEIKIVKQKDKTILNASSGYENYEWNTGENTASIEVKNPGLYYVKVTTNNNGFVYSNYIELK